MDADNKVMDLTLDKSEEVIRRSENGEKLSIRNHHCGISQVTFVGTEKNDSLLQSQKTDRGIYLERTDSPVPIGSSCESDRRFQRTYSVGKRAMDLSLHMRRNECRTIFEAAEYFSQNYSYKLMPITFESVNETIIHIEHNYCRWYNPPDTEADKGPVLYSDVEERNYKKRKSKESSEERDACDSDRQAVETVEDNFIPGNDCGGVAVAPVGEQSVSVQPLDLSLPFLEEQKTGSALTENQANISKVKSDIRSDLELQEFNAHESNKENVTSPSKKIEVTIRRPGQKEFYQPCEMFLNDVARISPDLIKNDCYEIDIIDRTRSRDEFESEKCRTYYIVSESTWKIFKNSTERIILTNDLNIGQPIQNADKFGKPTYIIFDQYSLTESLAEICKKKGGSFEYTCLEEAKEVVAKVQDAGRDVQIIDCDSAKPTGDLDVDEANSERGEGSSEVKEEGNAEATEGDRLSAAECVADGAAGNDSDLWDASSNGRADERRKAELQTAGEESCNVGVAGGSPDKSVGSGNCRGTAEGSEEGADVCTGSARAVQPAKEETRIMSGSATVGEDCETVRDEPELLGVTEVPVINTQTLDVLVKNDAVSSEVNDDGMIGEALSRGKVGNVKRRESDRPAMEELTPCRDGKDDVDSRGAESPEKEKKRTYVEASEAGEEDRSGRKRRKASDGREPADGKRGPRKVTRSATDKDSVGKTRAEPPVVDGGVVTRRTRSDRAAARETGQGTRNATNAKRNRGRSEEGARKESKSKAQELRDGAASVTTRSGDSRRKLRRVADEKKTSKDKGSTSDRGTTPSKGTAGKTNVRERNVAACGAGSKDAGDGRPPRKGSQTDAKDADKTRTGRRTQVEPKKKTEVRKAKGRRANPPPVTKSRESRAAPTGRYQGKKGSSSKAKEEEKKKKKKKRINHH